MPTPPLEELLAFPADFTFRVVCRHTGAVRGHVVEAVEGALGRAPSGIDEQASRRGAFRSIRVRARVENADEVRAVYAVLEEIEGVLMLL